MADKVVSIILAAGKGTRMKSALPKVLHKVGGLPMVQHVLNAAAAAGATQQIVVVGFGAEKVTEYVAKQAETVVQAEQLGTGHAVLMAEACLKQTTGTALILCGDTPLVTGEELTKFVSSHRESAARISILTALAPDPKGYGRILRSEANCVTGIVEEKDATAEQKKICEINTGIYCVELPLLFDLLHSIRPNNAQGEYYLTDIIAEATAAGEAVQGFVTEDFDIVMGVNSRMQLAQAERLMRHRTLYRLMDEGVTVMDPASTFVDATVKVGRDTVLLPFTWLEGNTVIGAECTIGPNVRLTNVKVGDNTSLQFLYGHDCAVGESVTAGPYVHLRPDTVIRERVKIGNFVEVKNSHVGVGTKLPHLTYIGDSDLGSGINMGCGCITVNYDGHKKHRTTIEDNAFVGCNTNLIAPVTVGAGAYIGAGSTITKDVPAESLAVERSKQVIIPEWVKMDK